MMHFYIIRIFSFKNSFYLNKEGIFHNILKTFPVNYDEKWEKVMKTSLKVNWNVPERVFSLFDFMMHFTKH